MADVWAQESEKHSGGRQYSEIRDLKFRDNATHHVRILPPKATEKPFVGYVIHWVPQANSKKGRPVIHAIDKRCLLCDYVHELWGEIHRLKEEEDMTDNSPEVKKVYSKIQGIGGKKKYDFNILDRDSLYDEVDGKKVVAPKRMTTSQSLWKPIFDYAGNKKWGNPADADKGYDLEITTEGEMIRRSYSISPDRNNSPLNKEETEALKMCYDLEKLRKPTSLKDIKDILEKAKSPFNDLVDNLTGSDDGDDEPKKTTRKEVEEPVEKEEPKEEVKKEEVKKEEPKVEETKTAEVEEPEVEEPEEEKPQEETKKEEPKVEETKTEESNEDETNLNSYECRGEYEKGEEVCDGNDTEKACPVKEKCIGFQPYYKKAKELKVDMSDERTAEDIVKDVDAKSDSSKEEKKEETSKKTLGKKKKNLPF